MEAFLDAVNIYDLESKTDDRTDFSVAFLECGRSADGIYRPLPSQRMNPLLDGRAHSQPEAEQSGVKLPCPL